MTTNQDPYAAAQAAIETRRALAAAESCHECGDPYWLCMGNPNCPGDFGDGEGADDALTTAAVNAYAADTEALAAAVARHAPYPCPDHVLCPVICDICGIEDWPCPDALAALTALGVAPC